MLTGLKPDADDRGIELLFSQQSDEDDNVVIDHYLVSIALFNLIDNAIKYSHRKQKVKPGSDSVTRCGRLTSRTPVFCIPDASRRYMFQPFSRTPARQAGQSRPGTGLGLAVVKQIVDGHDGRYRFTSNYLDANRPNLGAITVFTIALPRR